MREKYHDKQKQILIGEQQKLLIYSLANKLKLFQEQWYQISKQEEEELQYQREKYNEKQHKIMIG